MRERVEESLTRIRPTLGGADVRLVDVNGGIVTVEFLKQLSACAVKARGLMTKDLTLEMLEEKLREEVPEVTRVIVV